MDTQRAIDNLGCMRIEIIDAEDVRQLKHVRIDTVNVAISALEKQVPKKPIEKHYEDEGEPAYVKICCPNCCHVQVSKHDSYCCKCGQKLDWDIKG
ncbi:MAG: hypothetical protein RR809_09080 [Lachnospiraceae bacterium]